MTVTLSFSLAPPEREGEGVLRLSQTVTQPRCYIHHYRIVHPPPAPPFLNYCRSRRDFSVFSLNGVQFTP